MQRTSTCCNRFSSEDSFVSSSAIRALRRSLWKRNLRFGSKTRLWATQKQFLVNLMFYELQTYLSFSSSALFFKCLPFPASASFSWAFSRSFSVLISTALATISATYKDFEMTTFSINLYWWSMLFHHLRHHFRKVFVSFCKSVILTPFSLLPPSSLSGLLPWRTL